VGQVIALSEQMGGQDFGIRKTVAPRAMFQRQNGGEESQINNRD
jgi:hypothetical protein